MKWGIILVLANLLVISDGWATSFYPVLFEKLVRPADAVIIGDYLGSRSVELEDGTIATEARIKIEKETGIDADDFGLSEIKVYFPGGKTKEKVVHVEGAPQFVRGEKVAVLLGQQPDGRLWIQGLAMGTFKVIIVGKHTLLINSVFPSHPELSRIEIGRFKERVESIMSKPFRSVQSDKYQQEMDKERILPHHHRAGEKSRSIASTEAPMENEYGGVSGFWLVIILGFLGALVTWWGRHKA